MDDLHRKMNKEKTQMIIHQLYSVDPSRNESFNVTTGLYITSFDALVVRRPNKNTKMNNLEAHLESLH